MSMQQAAVTVTVAYTGQSISNTGGTVKETFADNIAADVSATATKWWSYIADGGTHNANLAAGGNITFTLSALVGALGTVAMTKVLAFVFLNKSTTDSVTVGAAALHPWAPLATAETVGPGGALVLLVPVSGLTVTSGSSDQVKIDATGAGAAVPFSLTVLGF